MKSKISNSEEASQFFTLAFLRGSESFRLLLLWMMLLKQFDTPNSEHEEISVKVTEMPKEGKKFFLNYGPIGISFLSLVVSIGTTVFTTITQRSFQERSLLPAISVYYSWDFKPTNEGQENIIKWKIENTGRGPAVVRNSFLKVRNNEKININDEDKTWNALISAVKNHFNFEEITYFREDSIIEGYSIFL